MDNPLTELSLAELRRRTSMKWRSYPADVLPLWVAEMDVALAGPVAAALTEALRLGDTGYPAGTGYAEAVRGFAAARWGWHLDVAATALMPDVMLGVTELLKLLTAPGDAVLVNPPVYPPFYAFVEHLDRRVLEAPLTADHRLDLDVLADAMRSAVTGGRRAAYLLCSPHNPTGTVHTTAELTAVAQVADRYGVRVVVDEIHAPLVLPGSRYVPYLSLPAAQHGFAVHSASKGWNLAGLKTALAVAGTAAAADLARVPAEVGHAASHLAVIAHVAALGEGRAWLDALLAGLDDNRRLLAELLARHLPAVRYRQPEATYLAWLDCRELGIGADPAAVFLDRGRVALNSGPAFGTGGSGHVRLNLATSPDLLTEAVRRMATAAG